MRHLGILSLIFCLATASGCNLCCWGKRNAELTGPTDIRKSQQWCLGEDAIFHQPMGPSRANYGMKQTCWREWRSDGPACANGSCGPILTPGVPPHQPEVAPQLVPPQQREPAQDNPFRDDAEPLPAPAKVSANGQSPPQRVRMAATEKPAEFQTLFTPPTKPTLRAAAPPSKPAPARPSPRVVVKPAPVDKPTQLAQLPASAPTVSNSDRLRITVSDAIDVPPARTLAPITMPGAVVRTSLPAPADFQETQETLAGLEQMVNVTPTTTNDNHPGPAVIRNEFAAPSKPFRLTTRSSRPDSDRDPELERQTLSALGSMMSGSAAHSSDE